MAVSTHGWGKWLIWQKLLAPKYIFTFFFYFLCFLFRTQTAEPSRKLLPTTCNEPPTYFNMAFDSEVLSKKEKKRDGIHTPPSISLRTYILENAWCYLQQIQGRRNTISTTFAGRIVGKASLSKEVNAAPQNFKTDTWALLIRKASCQISRRHNCKKKLASNGSSALTACLLMNEKPPILHSCVIVTLFP